jgi:hypothetical protein
MSRIIIHVDEMQGGGVSCAVAKAPFPIPGLHAVHVFNIDDLASLHGPDFVLQLGDGLAQRIRSNQKVDEVFNAALLHHNGGSLPFLFRVSDSVAHTLSWESIHANDRFLALEPNWPVGRVPSGGDIPEDTSVEFEAPLRMVVLVSALGRPGLAEWHAIYQRVQDAQVLGLPIHVTLIAAEDEVVEAAQTAQANGDTELVLEPVRNTPTELVQFLRDLTPELLHFFCHGISEAGVHLLEIGTVNDWNAKSQDSSVRLRVEELGEALDGTDVWAVVLNTCQSAAAPDDEEDLLALTHAEALVIKGVPVAIGMRRLVDQNDATTFSGSFYASAFETIRTALGGEMQIEWTDTLLTARRALRDAGDGDPATDDGWTLPVLYTRSGKFHLTPPDAKRTEGRLAVVGGLVDVIERAGGPPTLAPDLTNIEPDP